MSPLSSPRSVGRGPSFAGERILYRLLQQSRESRAGDLARAERGEVAGGLLAVDQAEALFPQPPHELDQGHLGGVGRAREHRLPEEDPPQRDTVKPAHELALAPRLDRM